MSGARDPVDIPVQQAEQKAEVEKIAEVAVKGLRKGMRSGGNSAPPPWPAPPRRAGRSRSQERTSRGKPRDPAPAERRNFGTPPPEDDCSEARFRVWVKQQFTRQEQEAEIGRAHV